MHKRPDQYVRIDRYQETYMDNYDEPLYELDIAAGYNTAFNEGNIKIFQKMISITMDDMKKLIIVAAVKLDDLLDDFNSVTEITK
jgi:hypothetical protein